MTFPLKGNPLTSGKRYRSKGSGDDDMDPKRFKTEVMPIISDTANLTRQRIYNIASRKKPAELFRKDLISAMKLPDSDQLNSDEYLLITDTWKEEWEKGVQVPVNPDSLPDGSQCRVLPSSLQFGPSRSPPSPKKERTKENQSSSPSNSPSSSTETYKMPRKLLKFEPDRDAIASKYEMDLTDHCWLETLKASEEEIDIPEDMLEEVMNELECNCATNMKAKHVGIEFDDHIVCDICRSPDAEDDNEMVFCDLCNICVHQACYGIPVIPDGEWLCRPCKDLGTQAKKISCIFCPNTGGAYKPTSDNRWAHVSCALWIPEVSFGCISSMEPVTKIKAIPSSRWSLVCTFCGVKHGAPIQCSEKTCKVAYHVTCAFNHHLKLKAVVEGDSRGVKLKSFCKKHSKLATKNNNKTSQQSLKDERNPSLETNSTESSNSLRSGSSHEIEIATASNNDCDKNNRFWMYIDINEINQTLMPKFKKEYPTLPTTTLQLFIDLIQQYWKMKRTSNYGLPLIKVITQDTIEEIQMAHRNDILRLRVNLERIRNLSYMICRREKIKRSWLTTHQDIVEKSLSLAAGLDLPSLVSDDDEEELVEPLESKSFFNFNSFYPFGQDTRVAPEEILLARNVINSNIIYSEDRDMDKFRSKKVIKELSRIVKINDLRSRQPLPNPYERKYGKSFKSSSRSSDSDIGERDIDFKSSFTPQKQTILMNGTSPKRINCPPTLMLKSPGKQRHRTNNNGKNPLSPTKRSVSENLIHGKSSSLVPNKSPNKQLMVRNNKHNHRNNLSPNSVMRTKDRSQHSSGLNSPKKKRQKRDKVLNGVISDELDDQRQACCIS